MSIFRFAKDGGPQSKVDGFWLVEWKGLFSIALLRFGKGSREAYHSHAFNAISWLLTGGLMEVTKDGPNDVLCAYYDPSIVPIYTPRERIHKVYGSCDSNWVLTFRGSWTKTWTEIDEDGKTITLTEHRQHV